MFFPPLPKKESDVDSFCNQKVSVSEQPINAVAQKTLSPPEPPVQESRARSWFNWFLGRPTQTTEEKNKLNNNREDSSQLSDDNSKELEKEQNSDLRSESNITDNKQDEDNNNNSTLNKKEQFDKTTAKTEQVGWLQWTANVIGGAKTNIVTAMQTGLQAYIESYEKSIDKKTAIASSKKIMQNNVSDHEFIELYDLINIVLVRIAKAKIDEHLKEGIIAQQLLPHRSLLLDLVEINLAKGFANLAEAVNAEKDTIPNYQNQSALVNVLSLLSRKVRKDLNPDHLANLVRQYKDKYAQLLVMAEEFPTGDKTDPELDLEKYLQDPSIIARKHLYVLEGQNDKAEKLEKFETALSSFRKLDKEFQQVFGEVADEILFLLFPGGSADLEIPPFPFLKTSTDFLYSFFGKDIVAKLLKENYESLVVDPTKWEVELKDKTGAPDLQPFLKAPSALLVALTKNFIQSDPRVGEITSAVIDSILNDSSASLSQEAQEKIKNKLKPFLSDQKIQKLTPEQLARIDKVSEDKIKELANVPNGIEDYLAREMIISQLYQQQLANWIVESIQTMLHTSDPNLKKLGGFIQQIFSNLTLALLAKGSNLLIPQGTRIPQDQFIKELSDKFITKFQSIQQQDVIPDSFWQEFVQDLPLPLVVKDLLIPILIEKAKGLQTDLKKANSQFDLDQIPKIEDDLGKTILSFENGKELLTIIQEVGNQIVERAFEGNIITTLGLGETIEELFAQYLPGVHFNDDLKTWFKNNFSSLGMVNGKTPRSVALLKQGIQVVLRKAVITAIENNFKNNSKDYVPQLLKNIHAAFAKALKNFDQTERNNLSDALAIQQEIKSIEKQIEALKKQLADKPSNLTPTQTLLIEDQLAAQIRYFHAAHDVNILTNKLNAILQNLNSRYVPNKFTRQSLVNIVDALNVQKEELPKFKDLKDYVDHLAQQANLNDQQKDNLASVDVLASYKKLDQLVLARMSQEELKLLADALHTEATLRHAAQELQFLSDELTAKDQEIQGIDKANIDNRAAWDEATKWLSNSYKNREELNTLSQKIKLLEEKLDARLKIFQDLAHELTALIGLNDKNNLQLPSFLIDHIWPLIENTKNRHIARMLFEQLAPLLLPALDLQQNKDKLKQLANNNELLGLISRDAANEVTTRLGDFISSYKLLAKQILDAVGEHNPSDRDIYWVEQTLKYKIFSLGKIGLTASTLQSLLADLVAQEKATEINQKLRLDMFKPLIKGLVQDKDVDALSLTLYQFVINSEKKEFSRAQIFALLDDKINPADKQKLRQDSKILAIEINRLLKKLVSGNKDQRISESLLKVISQDLFKLKETDIYPILQAEFPAATDKEKQKLLGHAKALAQNLNHFLINRGKEKLTPELLLSAYKIQRSSHQIDIPVAQEANVIQKLKSQKIVDKIRMIVMTPEEIAEQLNDLIPGATDLQSLITSQVQDVISGQDQSIQDNRSLVQKAIEGLLVQFFVKVAESNLQNHQGSLTLLTGKLNQISLDAEQIKNKSDDEIARYIIDEILIDVLGIVNQTDLEGIPPVFRKFAYEKLLEHTYQQLKPLVMPIVEREKNRQALNDLSGSNLLVNLSQALSKDVFSLLPVGFKSHRGVANKLIVLLSNNPQLASDKNLVERLGKEISLLLQKSHQESISHGDLVDAYMKAIGNPTNEHRDALKDKLKKNNFKQGIKNIISTPEEVLTEILGKAYPDLQKAIASELYSLIHDQAEAYDNISKFAGSYVEGILLKVFIQIAKKNPPEKDNVTLAVKKDSFAVMAERLLNTVANKYPDLKAKPFENVAEELNNTILQDIFGLKFPDSFEGIPQPLQEIAYNAIKDLIRNKLVVFKQNLDVLEDNSKIVGDVKRDAKKFGADLTGKPNLQVLADDLTRMITTAVPNMLTQIMPGGQMKGVTTIAKNVESYLEELARDKINCANELLEYVNSPQFQKLLKDNLEKIGSPNKVKDEKHLATLLSNMLLVPLNQAFESISSLEAQKKARLNQNLMANILEVAAGHMRNINTAKTLAANNGRSNILHQDFIQAAQAANNLHPGVPFAPVNYHQTLKLINERIFKLLDDNEKVAWKREEKKLCDAINNLVKDESKGIKVMRDDDVIAIIDSTYQNVKSVKLSNDERNALKTPTKDGLTLKQIIRQDADALEDQRKKEIYNRSTKAVMKAMFPNGKQDLKFIEEKYRGKVWKIFKNNLFPLLLPMLTELLIEPDTINQLVLSSLKTMRFSMLPLHKQPPADLMKLHQKGHLIVRSTKQPTTVAYPGINENELVKLIKNRKVVAKDDSHPVDHTQGRLDQISAALINEALAAAKLPAYLKKLIVHPKMGLDKTLGNVLLHQFNDTFLTDKTKMGLEKLVERNGDDYLLKLDPSTKAEKDAKAKIKQGEVQREIKQIVDEIPGLSFSKVIRDRWNEAQDRFDALIEKRLGKIGAGLKQALDAVFHFIFFDIVGTILSFLLTPVYLLIEKAVKSHISLDENREILLKLVNHVPADQPTGEHIVLHEDLIYKIIEATMKTVEDALLQAPAAPSDQPVLV